MSLLLSRLLRSLLATSSSRTFPSSCWLTVMSSSLSDCNSSLELSSSSLSERSSSLVVTTSSLDTFRFSLVVSNRSMVFCRSSRVACSSSSRCRTKAWLAPFTSGISTGCWSCQNTTRYRRPLSKPACGVTVICTGTKRLSRFMRAPVTVMGKSLLTASASAARTRERRPSRTMASKSDVGAPRGRARKSSVGPQK